VSHDNVLSYAWLLKTFHFDSINGDVVDSTVEPIVMSAVHSMTEESLQFWFQRGRFGEDNLP
jgi:hypothetical protein